MLGLMRLLDGLVRELDDFADRLERHVEHRIAPHQGRPWAYGAGYEPHGPWSVPHPPAGTPFAEMPQRHYGYAPPVVRYPQQYYTPPPAAATHGIAPPGIAPHGSLRPNPTSAAELARRRHLSSLAAEKRCVDRFLRELPRLDDEFDAAASAHGRGFGHEASIEFDALEPDIRAAYSASPSGRLQYMEEVAAFRTTRSRIDRALQRAGMHAVPNDGMTPAGRNDCLVLSVLHFLPLSEAKRLELAAQYRRILVDTPELALRPNAQISAGSLAARRLLELVNADPGLTPKLDVVVVSEQDGVVHRNRLVPSPPAGARTVVVWDQGGHFEALAPRSPTTRAPG
ncbi:hypothetical protein [Trinickia dinghuensis]|uniref:Uncharacterized protein n=1 Tax=Trinickia dinghuensis TaxID=2291023 RepID=A0A3D8JUI6_9BURK|nr:hypothetical protein [Trinickia dinghuensis]RDU96737.1 hypothetical protein DWV00_22345 [Trinickia dinghuensis]